MMWSMAFAQLMHLAVLRLVDGSFQSITWFSCSLPSKHRHERYMSCIGMRSAHLLHGCHSKPGRSRW